jgi:hypothetical protein
MMISKKLTITAGLFGVMALGIAASLPQQPQQGPPPKAANLKVLPKNISHKDLDHIMDTWATSLGVHCNFCHARNEQTNKMDFASDAKPEKTVARHMFEMTAKINKKYFKSEKDSLGMVMESSVNCYTCHRGSEHPEIKVPEREHKGPGGPPPGGTPPPPPPTPPSGK